jgi:SAM-dependent methyltransferase
MVLQCTTAMTSRSGQDQARWEELYATGARPDRPPSSWVIETVLSLPNELPVVDIAGGTGRHARPLARSGRQVVMVDIARNAAESARLAEPSLNVVVGDTSRLPLRTHTFGVVVVVNFLDRNIFSDLIELIAPGGYLVYETYTVAHLDLVERGVAKGPHSRDYLLQPDELPELTRPLTIVEYREGEVDDGAGRRWCARLLARKTS